MIQFGSGGRLQKKYEVHLIITQRAKIRATRAVTTWKLYFSFINQ